MTLSRAIYFLVFIVLSGCATEYQKTVESKRQIDPISSYKRSKTEATAPGPLYSFIAVEGEQIEVEYKPSMPYLQSRQQCDTQPYESYFEQPTNIRRCVQAIGNNCVLYQERFRGEPQPACLKTALLNNNCILREDPNQPTLKYRTRQDCYKTLPPANIIGQFQVVAVSEGTPSSQVVSQGRSLGLVSVNQPGQLAKFRLTERPKADECLAIVDAGNLVMAVRGPTGGQDPFLFATPQMRADKKAALLQKKADDDQKEVQRLRTQREEQGSVVLKNTAWKNDRCVMPPIRPVPPKPAILPDQDIQANARGVCFITLGGQLSRDLVMRAVNASQDFEYFQDAQRFLADPSKIAQCARRAYRYSDSDLAVLRGERGKKEYTDAPDFITGIIGLYSGAMRDATTTQAEKLNMVSGMLSSCSQAIQNNCRLPLSNWEQEARNINMEPEIAMKKCTDDVSLWQRFNGGLKEAEQKAAQSSAALRSYKAVIDNAKRDAGDAFCKAEGL